MKRDDEGSLVPEKVKVMCCHPGCRNEMFVAENLNAFLKCQKCGCPTVKFDRMVERVCSKSDCGHRDTIMAGKEVTAYHSTFPGHRGCTLVIVGPGLQYETAPSDLPKHKDDVEVPDQQPMQDDPLDDDLPQEVEIVDPPPKPKKKPRKRIPRRKSKDEEKKSKSKKTKKKTEK